MHLTAQEEFCLLLAAIGVTGIVVVAIILFCAWLFFHETKAERKQRLSDAVSGYSDYENYVLNPTTERFR